MKLQMVMKLGNELHIEPITSPFVTWRPKFICLRVLKEVTQSVTSLQSRELIRARLGWFVGELHRGFFMIIITSI